MKARRDAAQHIQAARDALLHDSSGAALANYVAK
jgi:hypothetical protein